MKVFVYFNLHKLVWSIKALEGKNKGRVIAHRSNVELNDCTFRVSESGRQRVLREKRKNVHAGIVGYWNDSNNEILCSTRVSYNPYKYGHFYTVGDNVAVYKAGRVCLVASNRGVFI